MGEVEIVYDGIQPQSPELASAKQLIDLDVAFLLRYLTESRGTRYKLTERPDELERQRPAPDYLIQEQPSGRVIAIEHTQLMREDLQRAFARRVKAGAGIVTYGPVTINPHDNALALMAAVRRKLARGQLQNAGRRAYLACR